jgi:pimeloyl-ACP methyl ester carboxylesterase
VIHGRVDPLVAFSGGEATAAAVPGAELVAVDDMGHSLPRPHWDTVVETLAAHTRKAG